MLMVSVIGESHADPFIAACVRDAETGEPLATTQVVHIPALLTSEFLESDRRLSPKLGVALAALRYIGCDDGSGRNRETVIDPSIIGTNVFSPRSSTGWKMATGWRGVPLMFITGELNTRHVIAAVPVGADVEVPFAPEQLERVPRFEPIASVSADSVRAVVAAQLDPMFQALRLLRQFGISPLVLHSISPPTSNDAQYLAETGLDTQALTRTKVVMLFNAALRAFAEAEKAIFIDRWDEVTVGGVVREGYLRDAVHLRNDVMRASLIAVYRALQPSQRSLTT